MRSLDRINEPSDDILTIGTGIAISVVRTILLIYKILYDGPPNTSYSIPLTILTKITFIIANKLYV